VDKREAARGRRRKTLKIMKEAVLGLSDVDLDPDWIRIQEGKNYPQK